MSTRQARLIDIPDIVKLTRAIHGDTHYRSVPLDAAKYKKTLRMMINSKQHLALISERMPEQGITGFFLGVTQPHFAVKGKFATDLMFYASPSHPGAGFFMLKRFLAWARERSDVTLILLGISNDLLDEERIGAFYERQGLTRTGGLYIWSRDNSLSLGDVA